jgi:hypothetical protein
MPFLLALALISTTGCAELIDARRDLQQWRDSLELPRQTPATQQQQTTPMQMQMQQQYGQQVYRAQDCIGAVVNGVCHGSTGAAQPQATCYGQMLNGQCTGHSSDLIAQDHLVWTLRRGLRLRVAATFSTRSAVSCLSRRAVTDPKLTSGISHLSREFARH